MMPCTWFGFEMVQVLLMLGGFLLAQGKLLLEAWHDAVPFFGLHTWVKPASLPAHGACIWNTLFTASYWLAISQEFTHVCSITARIHHLKTILENSRESYKLCTMMHTAKEVCLHGITKYLIQPLIHASMNRLCSWLVQAASLAGGKSFARGHSTIPCLSNKDFSPELISIIVLLPPSTFGYASKRIETGLLLISSMRQA